MDPSPGPSTDKVWRAIQRRSFCTLATSSTTGQPHVVGVVYAAVDRVLFVSTERSTKKARNLAGTGRAAICIPVRKYPVGPPFCVQFTASAELLAPEDSPVLELLTAGRLKIITSHGELDVPDACFVRLVPDRRLSTYGLGVPLRRLLRDPLHASRTIDSGLPS